MTKKVLLDTNILVYGWDTSSRFYPKIKLFLENLTEFYITDRTLLEFYRTYTGPIKASVKDTLEIVEYYLQSKNCHIIYSNSDDVFLTFQLTQEYDAKSGKIFDLNILATAIGNDIEILYTKNIKDYPQDCGIQIIDPTI